MTPAAPEKTHPTPAPAELLEGVERALAEVRRGSALVLTGPTDAALIRAAETVDTWPLPVFARPGVGTVRMAVTGKRAAILGLCDAGTRTVILETQDDWSPARIEPLVDPEAQGPIPPQGVKAIAGPVGPVADAAIRLMKIARLLPAALIAPLTTEDAAAWAKAHGRWTVTTQAIESYERMQAEDLRVVSEARVPLADAENTRIVSFRSRDGSSEHLAIVIGTLDLSLIHISEPTRPY